MQKTQIKIFENAISRHGRQVTITIAQADEIALILAQVFGSGSELFETEGGYILTHVKNGKMIKYVIWEGEDTLDNFMRASVAKREPNEK